VTSELDAATSRVTVQVLPPVPTKVLTF